MNHSLETRRDFNSFRKILVVEDDPIWRTLIQSSLRKLDHSFEIQTMKTVEEFQTSERDPGSFDLIISDHFLGGGQTGIEFWRELTSQNVKTPFLLASGLEQDRFFNLTHADLCHPHFIEKSLSNGMFEERVRSLLDLKKAGGGTADGSTLNISQGFFSALGIVAMIVAFSGTLTEQQAASLIVGNTSQIKNTPQPTTQLGIQAVALQLGHKTLSKIKYSPPHISNELKKSVGRITSRAHLIALNANSISKREE